ncbi:phosphatidate cytidylyltransferase [Planosporangium thailandense]|uniref:Phosphatidate cytidylyltransferase n=1 Tax=Planosporangium thailandense TaxID=765197 RepID=A0ABX0XQG5_9ACTN|nr:phosphatidate cytidylyltransferase [Planosporangium thailandense]NJC68219.1 phosphatidate cytidylyltransferase [Planosporangium thailandense]
MAHLDSPGWPDPTDPGHDDPRLGRQRARHADAAPDAYPQSWSNGSHDAETGFRLRLDADPPRERGRHAAAETVDDVPTAGLRPAGPDLVWGDPSATAEFAPAQDATAEFAAPQGATAEFAAPQDATAEFAAVTDDNIEGGDEVGQVEAAGISEASPTPAPVKKGGRAGRNLPAAIGVGVTLGGIVVASLFLWRPAFVAVAAVAMIVATWEMVRAVRSGGLRPPMVPLVAGGMAMAGLAWYGGAEALILGLIATAVAALVWRLADGPAGYHRDVVAAVLIAVYVPFLGGFAVLLARPDSGSLRVLATLAAVVLSDTGGYVAGVFFGKRPMAPSVSPKKSWEGTAGSLLAAAVGGALMLHFMVDVPWWHGALFGLAVAVAGVLGDLAESLIKRDLGIKDMSSLLPGHGGLMDRLDSILFAVPTAVAVLALVAPVTT